MTPKGIVAYAAGLLVLCGGLGLFLFAAVGLLVFAPHAPAGDVGIVLGFVGLIVFVAAHLLAAGLYRMLTHLYRAISRTDPAGDRPLRGRTIYLLGQIGGAMAVPMLVLFLLLQITNPPNPNGREQGLVFGAMGGVVLMTMTATIFFTGLGLMVRDLFLRHRDIVDKHEADRRRRLAEREDLQTEVIPPVHPGDELREHVREDRR